MVEVVGHNKHYSYFLFLLLVSECRNNHLIHCTLNCGFLRCRGIGGL